MSEAWREDMVIATNATKYIMWHYYKSTWSNMLGGRGGIGERYLKRGYTKFVKGKKELGI